MNVAGTFFMVCGDNNTACLFLAEDLDNLYRAGLLEGLAFFTG